jgi:hypothetical protein
LRFRRPGFVLKFPNWRWECFYGRELCSVDCAERPRSDRLLVINNYGKSGTAFVETDVADADLETVISDLMSGQYSDPVRVVAFNTAEHWAEDASEDIARETMRRLDLAGREMPSSIEAFIERHIGHDRQLSLRLA